MQKKSLIGAIAAVLVGGGLIWTAGSGNDQGIKGWEPLNAAMARAVEGGPSVDIGDDPDRDASGEMAAGENDKAEAGRLADRDTGRQAAAGESIDGEAKQIAAKTAGESGLAGSAEANGQWTEGTSTVQDSGGLDALQQSAEAQSAAEAGSQAGVGISAVEGKGGGSPAGTGDVESDNRSVSRSGTPDTPPSAEGKVNVNTAGIDELTDLPGIGEKKAQAILDYRKQHGMFRNASDLGKVKGIGPKMLEKMKPYLLF